MMARPLFQFGEPVPDFTCRSSINNQFNFRSLAGRYVVLSFLGSTALEKSGKVLSCIKGELKRFFRDDFAVLFGVSVDPQDERRTAPSGPRDGTRFFWDFDCEVSAQFGAVDPKRQAAAGGVIFRAFTLVLDPTLRVLANIPMADPVAHNDALARTLRDLPPTSQHGGQLTHAPILIVPRIFEPALCEELIALYNRMGGEDSGFMREQDGKTVGMLDHKFKRRSDFFFDHQAEFEELRHRLRQRLADACFRKYRRPFNLERRELSAT